MNCNSAREKTATSLVIGILLVALIAFLAIPALFSQGGAAAPDLEITQDIVSEDSTVFNQPRISNAGGIVFSGGGIAFVGETKGGVERPPGSRSLD